MLRSTTEQFSNDARPYVRTSGFGGIPAQVVALALVTLTTACTGGRTATRETLLPQPEMVAHSAWEVHPPLGFDAIATRRNLAPGDSLVFRDLGLSVVSATASGGDAARDVLVLNVNDDESAESVTMVEGSARVWHDYRIAVIAVHLAEGELGRGLAELEVAVASSVPDRIRNSDLAGGPADRLRIRHTPTHVTLHHSGSEEPLRPEDDPREKLQNLQVWGETDRGWWDVPYHFLLDLDGTIYEGRSFRYAGETNTSYNPTGHVLISVLGNYNLQEPTPAQINAIADLMAWAVDDLGIPLDHIQGHSDVATTSCPGDNLRKYLHDGTFKRLVVQRISEKSSD